MTTSPRQLPGRSVALGVVLGVLLTAGVVVGGGFLLLNAFNPLADEYQCSQGEVPVGPAPVAPGEGTAGCFQPDAIPRGMEADPFGNRPLSSNCDKDAYRLVTRTEGRGADNLEDCISVDTEIPSGWGLSADQ